MIDIRDLTFAYSGSDFKLSVPALHVEGGEKVALIGPSGVGKTTLISLIAAILRPRHGHIEVDGVEVTRLGEAGRRNFRISSIGFVFQEFKLLEYLRVRENILLPYSVNRSLALDRAARQRAEALAESMGIGKRLRRYPRQLSQGERQRVAICRALVAQPGLIIADEPTGNLDPRTARTILDLLFEQVSARGATLLMVTHNHELLDLFDRVVDIASYGEEVER